jgi:hypothetical protein
VPRDAKFRAGNTVRDAIKRALRPLLQRSPALRAIAAELQRTWRRLRAPSETISFAEMTPDQAFRVAFNVVLRREPTENERRDNLPALRQHVLPRDELVKRLHGSIEYRFGTPFTQSTLPQSLHMSRCEFIVGLPRARTILDIGGGDVNHAEGALVAMGYP